MAKLLTGMGFSLQANTKTLEGAGHPDRDAQFRYLTGQVAAFTGAGQPVVSVGSMLRRRSSSGRSRNAGREYARVGHPVPVKVHDFLDPELGKAIPDGIYDVAADEGWVSVGTDHDTSAFAVATLTCWWDTIGRTRYPGADQLLICADSGGSNGSRVRAWKIELAAFAAATGFGRHRRAPAAGHQQVEQNRAPPVLPDQHELARPTPAYPPGHRRPHPPHHHPHRADRARRPGHRRLPQPACATTKPRSTHSP